MTDRSTFERVQALESSARSYPASFPVTFRAASGHYLIDTTGREYLDFFTEAGVNVLGHNHPAIRAKLAALDMPLVSSLDLTTTDKAAFFESLLETFPQAWRDDLKFHCCGPTGSDAIEAALKLARIATGRSGIIAFSGSYHGMSQGALSVTSDCGCRQAGLHGHGDVSFAYFPHPGGSVGVLRDPEAAVDFALAHLATLLEDDHSGVAKPAAVVLELIQGEGGNVVAPERFVAGLASICQQHGVLIIVDEIQSGIGRTGTFWASEHYRLRPDIVCMSKGLGGGFPIAMLAYRRALDVWGRGHHIGTFRGQAYAYAAGQAVIETVLDGRTLPHVRTMGDRLRAGLDALAQTDPSVVGARGRGLYQGLELTSRAVADQVQQALFAAGIMVETVGREAKVLRFLPPLLVTADEIDRVLVELAAALAQVRARQPARHDVAGPDA